MACSGFPERTAVTITSVGKASGNAYKSRKQWRVIETTTLIAVASDRIELRIEVTEEVETNEEAGVKKVVLPARKVTHPWLVNGRPPDKPEGLVEQGEKVIIVDSKHLKEGYSKVEETNFDAERSVRTIQTWASDDMLDGVIRRESEMTGTYWYWDHTELTRWVKPAK